MRKSQIKLPNKIVLCDSGQTQSTHRPQIQNDRSNTSCRNEGGTKIANGNDFKFVNRQMYFGWEFFWAILPMTSAEYNYRSGAQQYRQFVGMHMRDTWSWYVYPRDRGGLLMWMVQSSFCNCKRKCNTLPVQKISFNQHNYIVFFTPVTVNCNQSSFFLHRTLWAGPFIQNTCTTNPIINNVLFTPIFVNWSWQCEIKVHFCLYQTYSRGFCWLWVVRSSFCKPQHVIHLPNNYLHNQPNHKLCCFVHTEICKLKLAMQN